MIQYNTTYIIRRQIIHECSDGDFGPLDAWLEYLQLI